MKKYEILYNDLIAKLNYLADSPETEVYVETLTDNYEDVFIAITEQLRGFAAELFAAKAAREHYEKWLPLRQCLIAFSTDFGNFPNFSNNKLSWILMLAERISQAQPLLNGTDIDEQMFEVRRLQNNFPSHLFVYQNAKTFSDSIVIFTLSSLEILESSLSALTLSPELLFHLLAAVQSVPVLTAGHSVMVKKTNPSISDVSVEAFACLSLLMAGHPIHEPHSYINTPQLIDRDGVQAGSAYSQMNEVMYVLSEYNSRKDVLSKYLSIYHVIENFMYRFPIVQLEDVYNGKMFSIRDFQTLYKEVSVTERYAIEKLIGAIAAINYSPGQEFKAKIKANWDAAIVGKTPDELQSALGKFGLKRGKRPMKANEFSEGSVVANFAHLVYGVRCAAVHNKETEFHLTYQNIDATIQFLIEQFLIPTLEQICFYLVYTKNDVVWYKNQELKLFA